MTLLRRRVPPMPADRYLAPDIEAASAMVADGSLAGVLRDVPALPALWIEGRA
jgi:histidine ammonia-lyase